MTIYLIHTQYINFTTLFGVKVANSCLKKLPVNLNLFPELFIHTSFGERLLFAVKGGSIFSFDNPLDFHSEIMSERPENIVIVL